MNIEQAKKIKKLLEDKDALEKALNNSSYDHGLYFKLVANVGIGCDIYRDFELPELVNEGFLKVMQDTLTFYNEALDKL